MDAKFGRCGRTLSRERKKNITHIYFLLQQTAKVKLAVRMGVLKRDGVNFSFLFPPGEEETVSRLF